MPDTPPPAAQPEPSSEPIEFNFDKTASENPRIKRRSLKAKTTPGLKPAAAPASARELEREAPSLSAEQAAQPAVPVAKAKETPRTTPAAPPRTTPTVSAATTSPASTQTPAPASISVNGATETPRPAPEAGVSPIATGQKVNISLTAHQKATAAVLAASKPSPHGTRPATLYYTSQPKKEASDSMKTTPTASSASTPASSSSAAAASRPANGATATSSASRPAATAASSSTSATRPASAAANPTTSARPAAAATQVSAAPTATRPAATNFDYRANVERQSREQKSVGSILGYFVYSLIAVFLIGAGLATYGSVIIFDKLHDQSTNITSLDDKYSAKVDALNKQLATTQDALTQAQAQTARQLDLLNKQEEEINQLRTAMAAASAASADAIHAEAHARSQEAAALRARIREVENRTSLEPTITRP